MNGDIDTLRAKDNQGAFGEVDKPLTCRPPTKESRWDVSGASMQARRIVIRLLTPETQTVSTSPPETSIAALTVVIKQSSSNSAADAGIASFPSS